MYLSVGICRFIMAINFQSIEKKTTKNYLTLMNQEITLYCKGANLLDITKSIYAPRETVRRVANSLVKQKLLMYSKHKGYCVTSKLIKKHQSYLSKEIAACKKFIKK
jgi:DNA-binding IclR family transcriptional regulator